VTGLDEVEFERVKDPEFIAEAASAIAGFTADREVALAALRSLAALHDATEADLKRAVSRALKGADQHAIRRSLERDRVARQAASELDARGAAASGSFADRLAAARHDLVGLVEDGLPPLEYLPASDGMLVRGARHYWPSPRKSGKSIGTLNHVVSMIMAGASVTMLDRENGKRAYAQRLEDIMAARGIEKGSAEADVLRENLRYFEFLRLKPEDGPALAEAMAGSDLVVFDSQRMHLTDLGLEENSNDDYAMFMALLVDPLQRASVATLILDNTGHEAKGRGRGASAKEDLNEIILTTAELAPWSRETVGHITVAVEAGNTRHGNEGVWTMVLGGGVFEPFLAGPYTPGVGPPKDFADAVTAYLRRNYVNPKAIPKKKLLEAVRETGVPFNQGKALEWVQQMCDDPSCLVEQARGGITYHDRPTK
jgi:hypothetical protein